MVSHTNVYKIPGGRGGRSGAEAGALSPTGLTHVVLDQWESFSSSPRGSRVFLGVFGLYPQHWCGRGLCSTAAT